MHTALGHTRVTPVVVVPSFFPTVRLPLWQARWTPAWITQPSSCQAWLISSLWAWPGEPSFMKGGDWPDPWEALGGNIWICSHKEQGGVVLLTKFQYTESVWVFLSLRAWLLLLGGLLILLFQERLKAAHKGYIKYKKAFKQGLKRQGKQGPEDGMGSGKGISPRSELSSEVGPELFSEE